jgi:Leucine-rich repeat (LRR) protein
VLTELSVFASIVGVSVPGTCFDALPSFSRLRALTLGGVCSELPALPSRLEELAFCSSKAKQISSISALTCLRSLNLACENLVDISPILACSALESLEVSRCSSLTVWPDLGALKTLRDLMVEHSTGLDDWSCLAALTALTRLKLREFSPDVNVEALAGLTQLQDLALSSPSFGFVGEDSDFWQECLIFALSRMVGLRKLDIRCARLMTLRWCSALPNLRSLCVSGNDFKSLKPLSSCPLLTELSLSSCRNLTSLSGLHRSLALSKLDISFCYRVSSLVPLLGCTKLSEINLEGCQTANMPGLDHLRGLPGLKIRHD